MVMTNKTTTGIYNFFMAKPPSNRVSWMNGVSNGIIAALDRRFQRAEPEVMGQQNLRARF